MTIEEWGRGIAEHARVLLEVEHARLDRELTALLVACVPLEELTILEYWPIWWTQTRPYRRVVVKDMIPELIFP